MPKVIHYHIITMYHICFAVLCLVTQLCPTPWNPMDCSLPGTSVHWDSPGRNIGMSCHALLQGIFPTNGSNLGLLHWRRILYHLSHQESPRILEWVAYPCSRGSSQPRNQTGVSCIPVRFFTSWATREAQNTWVGCYFLLQGWNRSLLCLLYWQPDFLTLCHLRSPFFLTYKC